ncbi:MAG: tetratricopeptide repeat protein [Phormidesmis sp.]
MHFSSGISLNLSAVKPLPPLKALKASAEPPEPLADVVAIYLQQAESYCNEAQWEKATGACKKALRLAPKTAQAYKLLGNILQRQGKLTDAMGFYAKALTLQPNAAEIYSNLGSLYARKQVWDSAIAYYQKAIEKDPGFAIAYANLAKVWKQLGHTDKETDCLQTALKLQPEMGTAQSHYRVGQALEAADQPEAAVAFYRQAIQREANFLPAYQRLADLLEDQGDWQAAVTCYRQVVTLSAEKNTVRSASLAKEAVQGQASAPINVSKRDQHLVHKLLQASSQKQVLRPPIATSAAPQAPQAAPSPTQLSAAQLGQRYAKAKDWPRAIQHLQQAIQQNPQSAALYRQIAATLARNHQPQQAAIAWYRAFTLEPDWPNAKQCLQVGDALFEQGKLEAAIHCYRQAIRRQPSLAAAYQQLAKLLRSQGSPDAAAAVLRRLATIKSAQGTEAEAGAIANEPQQRALAVHKQGEAHQEKGQWKKAIAAYSQAIQLNANFSWSHHRLGDCYKKTGDWQAAAAAYRKALKLNPDFVWSYYSLAEVAEKLAAWPTAAQHYRQVLTLEPENAQAGPRLVAVLRQLLVEEPRNIAYYQELAEQLVSQADLDEAIATYQMALQIRPDESAMALALAKLIAQQDPQRAHALIDRALSNTVTNRDIQSPEELGAHETAAALLTPTRLFDARYYRATNPDLDIVDDQALLRHYLSSGSAAGRNPNPLFDEQFYRDRHPEIAKTGANPLAHFHRFGHQAGHDPHPFFKTAFYQDAHPDVAAAGINPLEHYLAYGAKEGRVAFSAEQFSHIIDRPTPPDADYLAPLRVAEGAAEGAENTMPTQQRLGIYCNSLGNYFITEIADFIAAAFSQAGHQVMRLSENDPPPDNLDGHWVIAPHEFFYLGDGPQWAQRQQWLSQAIIVNVEQPQTTWFSKAFHFLRHTKIIFDINVKSAAIMQALKLPAYWLPLGYLPQYAKAIAPTQLPDLRALKSLSPQVAQQLPEMDAPLGDRPIDLHFIGTLNPRREQFFATSAHWLSQYRCFLHIPPMGVPLIEGQDQALDTSAVVGLSRRSKILLNVHRDDLPYFEWHRIMFHGLWQSTLVVTEPCHDIPGLVAGEHFIECPLADMASKIEWLLSDAQGQAIAERIRRAGHLALKERFDGRAIAANALRIANQALASKNFPKNVREK